MLTILPELVLWKEWLLHRSSLSLQRCPCSMWQRPLPVKLAPSRARRIMPRPLPSFRHVERHSKFASQSRTNLQAASSSSKSKLHTSPTQLLPTARAAPSLRRRTVASRAHNLLAAVLQLATLLQLSTNAANLNKHMVAVFPDVHNSRVSTHGGPDQHHLQLHPKFLTRKSRSLRAALSSSRPHPPPRLHCLLYCTCCTCGYCRGGHVRVPVYAGQGLKLLPGVV